MRLFGVFVTVISLLCVLAAGGVLAQANWTVTKNATDFVRGYTTDSANLARVKDAGNLAGKKTAGDWFGVAGWFEYDVTVPENGWYELIGLPDGLVEVNVIIDGKQDIFGEWGAPKVCNLWLAAGKHTIRLQRLFWTGFSPITGFELKRSTPVFTQSVFVDPVRGQHFIRKGDAKTLQVTSGGWDGSGTLTIQVTNDATGAVAHTAKVEFPKSAQPVTKTVNLPCPTGGAFTIKYLNGETPIETGDLRPFRFTVIDATPLPQTGGDVKRTLLLEVDCAKQAPDFRSYYDYPGTPYQQGLSRLVERPFGGYRETGPWGYRSYQNAANPCWFAYKFEVPAVQQPYVMEVDYPDDAPRTSLFAIREGNPLSYPVCGGADTGGPFQLTYQLQTQTMLFWPRSTDLRLLVINPYSESRAAAAKFRVYKIEGDLPLMKTNTRDGRHYLNWYEEGSNFTAMYGMPSQNTAGMLVAADRWARAVAYMGGNTLAPTVSVYQMCLFPSKFSQFFARDDMPDIVRMLLLLCEKYHLSFLADFYPESRDLEIAFPDAPDPRPNYSVNRYGKVEKNITFAFFSMVHPTVETQVMNMVGEYADRYKDSPALKGIMLRQMEWANHGLYNFNNLDWGYDDYTVDLFSKETGTAIPVQANDPGRFAARYNWLMANARDKWIDWRCAKVTAHYTRIRDRMRQARPDLKVYVVIHSEYAHGLRGAGIDTEQLKKIDGIVLVNALASYGRQGNEPKDTKNRWQMLDPAALREFSTPTSDAAFMNGIYYIEATGEVAKPEHMGYPANTKTTWMSGVANPSGRQYLERFALQLAEADATMCGDGGNTYTLGQPLLREFLQEFRMLPAQRFTPREDARDPAAVWALNRPQDFLFYAVNREGYPVTLTINLAGAGKVYRLATEEQVPLKDGTITVELLPYQLRTFKADAGMRITQVVTTCPPDAVERATAIAKWLVQTQADVEAKTIALDNATHRAHLKAAAEGAQSALTARRYWRVRTLAESPQLYDVYKAVKRYPRFTPFRVVLSQLLPPWWTVNAITKQYPQKETADPDTLATVIPGAKIEPCAALGEITPLVTWGTKTVAVKPACPIAAPQRFVLWARMAVYPNGPRITVTDATGKTVPLQPQSTETGLQIAATTEPITLAPGNESITLTVEGAGKPYLEQLFFFPEFTEITAEKLRFVGYFPNPNLANWEKTVGPEGQPFDPAATFDGFDGKETVKVGWQPFPKVMYNYVHLRPDQCPPGPPGPSMIAYAHATITSPTERNCTLFFNGRFRARIYLNGTLIVDSVKEKYNLDWYTGRFIANLPLKAGVNHVLVKMGNGDGPNDRATFIIAEISDPGDLVIEP